MKHFFSACCLAALPWMLSAATTGARLHIPTPQGAVWLNVEVVDAPGRHRRGLMDRAHLPANAGMLFLYRQAQKPDRGFWMYRTRIPLDIAFLGADGRILVVLGMEPCSSRLSWLCPAYRPGIAYWAALEVNRGFFERHGIGAGDRVMLPAGLAPSQ